MNNEKKNIVDCLDKGFVRLVDSMGGDDAIVQAARVSYGQGTSKVSQDRGLIRYLMRHRHTHHLKWLNLNFTARCQYLLLGNGFDIGRPT